MGNYVFTLQNKKTQTPFFIWQWYSKDESIELKYAVEDFSIPVKNIKAAGQDLINKERFMAASSIGAIVEGSGERDEPSLIIPIPQIGKKDSKKNYFLTFSESVNIGQDYRLDVKLQEIKPKIEDSTINNSDAGNSSSIKAVIIDTNPQFIGLLDARFLQQPGYDDGAWILARRSQLSLENGAWEILDDSANTEGFKLILPPQAIGEAYVKNNATHDPKPVLVDDNGIKILNHEGKPILLKDSGEPMPDQPIDFRFGAPAILRLANERLERRYVAPPWNLRHIWGQPGSELPGVPFLESQFELLYGLTGYLKPEKANIAELASKLGEIPPPPTNSINWNSTEVQNDTFYNAWKRYLQFYRAWKSRLAILEPSKEDAFGTTKFIENLKYSPRIEFRNKLDRLLDKAEVDTIIQKLKEPAITQRDDIKPAAEEFLKQFEVLLKLINDNESLEIITTKHRDLKVALDKNKTILNKLELFERFGASLRYPIFDQSLIPENGTFNPEDVLDPEKRMYASHDKNGLAGGFHYGFESKEIYKEVWREAFKKGSSSAELENLAYSSLGGWGKQTARFAEDKSIIKSTTVMGRTHFYAVERIGRIGVLWHKAKHVIEYERTIIPSDYFKEQPEHLGRPLDRKVREYVEILEPVKSYPDFQGQSDDAPGSIKGCHFKSKIIPVRSSWGKDVSFKEEGSAAPLNYGWEIQLWHPEADPKLFPKPQVVFELIPPKDSNIESVMVNLSEPQNLRFYTDTREFVDLSTAEPKATLTADTSKWPAIKYVDYTDLPLPNEKHLAPALDANSGKGLEYIMPDILEVPPGFERFSFRVDENDLPAGVANRYNPKSGISGKLQAVTMMRKPIVLDDNGNEIKPNTNPAFELVANSKESVINKICNGGLIGINSVEEIKTRLFNIFNGPELSNLIEDLIDDNNINLKHFDVLYNSHYGGLQNIPTQYLWKEAIISAEGLLNRALATYTEQANKVINEIKNLITQAGDDKQKAFEALNQFKERIGTFHLNIDYGIEFFALVQNQLETALTKIENNINHEAQKVIDFSNNEEARLQNLIDLNLTNLQEYRNKTIEVVDIVIKNTGNLVDSLNKVTLPNTSLNALRQSVAEILLKINKAGENIKTDINTYPNIAFIKTQLVDLKTLSVTTVHNYKNELTTTLLDKVKLFETTEFNNIQGALFQFKADLINVEKDIEKNISDAIQGLEQNWNNGAAVTEQAIITITTQLKEYIISETAPSLKSLLEKVLYHVPLSYNSIFGILTKMDEWITNLINDFKTNLLDNFRKLTTEDEVGKWLANFKEYATLAEAIKKGNKEEIIKRSTELANSLNREFGKLAGEIAEKIKELDQVEASFENMRNSGKQVLDNYRSVWDEFTAPGMGLNRKTIAMIVNKDWRDVEERLSITPCISRIKQFENDLEGLGIRLPVTNILEGLIPPKPEWEEYGKSLLDRFNFSDVLSDIGAMRLNKLFPNFKMPNNLRDNVKITQGFDKQNLFAWVNAEIDFKLDAPQSILSIGPIDVKLNQGKFIAKIRMEMDVEGNTKKQNSGMLAGDWETNIGGTPIMIFKDAKAIFEDDKLSFDLDPNRMEMPGLLKLLTDATKNIPSSSNDGSDGSEDPFKIGLLEVRGEEINQALTGRNIPIGIKASLDIPPVSVGGGTTSMTNLSFGGHFQLQFWDTELHKFGFMTGLGFYLGKQNAPFNFTAFILGGGGYINSNIIFNPDQGLSVRFVMSVHASVGFALTLGWMNGSILILMGFEGEYNKSPNTESSVYVTIFIQIIGTVDIMRLVSVYLGLRLAATYNGSQMVGKGQVKLKIKICWCLTIKVDKQYQKTFIGSDTNKTSQSQTEEKAIKISNTLS